MRRWAIVALCLTVSIGGVPAVASAHAERGLPIAALSDLVSTSVLARSWSGAVAFAAVGSMLAVAQAGRRRGRVLVAQLALALVLNGFEVGVHSVHHLGDASAAERCVVASSAGHTHAIDVPASPGPGAFVLFGTVLSAPARLCRSVLPGPRFGRAPPV
jgi:hypothetical protein